MQQIFLTLFEYFWFTFGLEKDSFKYLAGKVYQRRFDTFRKEFGNRFQRVWLTKFYCEDQTSRNGIPLKSIESKDFWICSKKILQKITEVLRPSASKQEKVPQFQKTEDRLVLTCFVGIDNFSDWRDMNPHRPALKPHTSSNMPSGNWIKQKEEFHESHEFR